MNSLFKGTGVALVTPFNQDKSIDFDALTKLIEHVISGKVDYLVVMGTTAESPALSAAEKEAVLNHVIKHNAYRLPIVYGIGGNNTDEVVNKIKNSDFKGVSGILSVTPYYNKPSQEGLYHHFKAIAEATKLPVILYNVPGRTGCNMSAATCIKLASECKNIVAVKEASGNFEQIMQIRKNAPKKFLVISGDDALVVPQIAIGVDGVISVAANAFPAGFSKMVNAALNGNFITAREVHFELIDQIGLMFAEGSPAGIKSFLSHMGIVKNILRLPCYEVSKQLHDKIGSSLK